MNPVVVGTITSTISMATPLLIAALGENVVQKAGVVNVGIEGMMLLGAFAGMMAARPMHLPLYGVVESPWLGFGAAALVGMLFAALFAFFAIKLTANQVVVGVVINLFAIGLTGTIYRAVFGETGTFITIKTLPETLQATLIRYWHGFGNTGALRLTNQNITIGLIAQNLLPLAAFSSVPMIWWWINRTRGGLELRACGEQPAAAEASGIDVPRKRTLALLFGGMMAGVAGACLSVGDVGTFKEEMTAGRGFIALAIVTSGRWNPIGSLIAALVFGFAQALQFQFQASGLKVSSQLFLALPYVVTLVILVFGGRRSQAPAALGRPYRKS